jgi:hypothetical protein
MVRAVLLALMSVAAVATCGCKSRRDAPHVEPGAAAGKVIEVAGTVTVGTRQLATGDTIKSDDTIETGADGSVVIELAHNLARWELGPNRKVKPTESVAWTAEPASGPVKPVDQVTSSGGCPAEGNAADTSISAGARGSARPSSVPEAASAAQPPPPPPAAQPAPGPTTGSEPKHDRKGEPQHARAPGQAVPHTLEPAADIGGAAADAEDGTSAAVGVFSACLAKGAKVTLKVHVANHVPSIKFVGTVDTKVRACITNAAKKLRLPIESGDLELDVTRQNH